MVVGALDYVMTGDGPALTVVLLHASSGCRCRSSLVCCGGQGRRPGDRRVAAGPEGGRRPPAGPALRKSRGSCNQLGTIGGLTVRPSWSATDHPLCAVGSRRIDVAFGGDCAMTRRLALAGCLHVMRSERRSSSSRP